MAETTIRRAGRPNEEAELFQAAELERMGLLPARGDGGAGTLFVGDGDRAGGWYRAWAGEGLTVVTCDFTVLRDTLFAIDTRRYLTVRGRRPGAEGRAAPPGPAAIAYIETREGWVTTPVAAGSRFAYTEVEYFEGALRDAFAELGQGSIDGLSSLLAETRHGVGWAPGVLSALDEIARADPAAPGRGSSTTAPRRRPCPRTAGRGSGSSPPWSSRTPGGARARARRRPPRPPEWASPGSSGCSDRRPGAPGRPS